MCTACAAPADMMERAIEQAPARVTDVSLSNQIDGKRTWNRYVSDPRCSSPALTAMPLSQVGWCHILLRSDPRPRRAALRDFSPVYVRFGSIASDQTSQRLRRMSAMPPIATNPECHIELSRSANRALARHRSKDGFAHGVV